MAVTIINKKILNLKANMDIIFYSKTHLYEKGGHKFYNITDVKVGYTMSGMKLRLNNLFNGVKDLGKQINHFK